MGGRIEVESSLGYGSTFHVRIPLPEGQAPLQTGSNAGSSREALPPLNVLIADDVPQNLELLALTLEGGGHQVTMASNGGEAVERFKNGFFDVVLMDVHMPDVDGLQATRLIRQHERTSGSSRRTPIIALTASVMDEDRRAATQAGMDGFATKPLDRHELFEEMARVLALTPSFTGQEIQSDARRSAPNVDWAQGIAVWGSKEKLIEVLRRFFEGKASKVVLPDYTDMHTDWNALQFDLHGLCGVAGNMALMKVSELAGRMEDLLKAGRREGMDQMLAELRGLLLDAEKELTKEAGVKTTPVEPSPVTGAVEPPLPEIMEQLRDVLRRNELDDALLEMVCRALDGANETERSQALCTAVNAFEFDEAAALLEQLIDDYGGRVLQ